MSEGLLSKPVKKDTARRW